MNKLINTGASWSSGENGNLYFQPPGATFQATQNNIFSVLLIRRESDGLVDYCAVPQTGTLTDMLAFPIVNTRYLIDGVGWRVGGLVGQLLRPTALGRFIGSTQVGKTTYLSEALQWVDAGPSVSFIQTGTLPVGRRGLEFTVGPRADGAADWVRVANNGLGSGFPLAAHLFGAGGFRYITPYSVTRAAEIFAFSAPVAYTTARFVYWENEYLAKLGF
jgi:hypothetical protein